MAAALTKRREGGSAGSGVGPRSHLPDLIVTYTQWDPLKILSQGTRIGLSQALISFLTWTLKFRECDDESCSPTEKARPRELQRPLPQGRPAPKSSPQPGLLNPKFCAVRLPHCSLTAWWHHASLALAPISRQIRSGWQGSMPAAVLFIIHQ